MRNSHRHHHHPRHHQGAWSHRSAVMSRSFYVDSLIIKDTVRPGPADHPGQDFLIPISMHSPSVMSVTAPVCPSRKTGTFCVCPLCVTSHIHAPCSGIPMLKSQFPGAEAQYCQRLAQQQPPALAHPGHAPVCTPTFSVRDPRRYHYLSMGKHLFAAVSAAPALHRLALLIRKHVGAFTHGDLRPMF